MQHTSKEYNTKDQENNIDKETGPEKDNDISHSSSHIYLDNQVNVGVGEATHDESSQINVPNTTNNKNNNQTKKPKSTLISPRYILNDNNFSMGSPRYPVTSNRERLINHDPSNSVLPK